MALNLTDNSQMNPQGRVGSTTGLLAFIFTLLKA